MKDIKQVIKNPFKATKAIGVLLLITGLFILLSAVYGDLYTVFEQSVLRNEWQTEEANKSVDNDTTNTPEKESSTTAGKKETREKNISNAGNKQSNKTSVKNVTETVKPAKHVTVKLGSAFARIEIPRIKLDAIVVEGVSAKQLALGPGHMEETSWPGEVGNMVISGHRVTHSRPFYSLDRLEIGDPIIIYTKSQKFIYNVVEKKVVKPTDLSVIKPTKNRILTLTTCNPRFSAKTRLIIHAKMY